MAKDYREKVVETIGEQKEREIRDQVAREKAEKQANQVTASYKDLKRETPMSYTEAKKAFDRIRDMCDVKEYSAHDFRDTCATEWRDSRKALAAIVEEFRFAKIKLGGVVFLTSRYPEKSLF